MVLVLHRTHSSLTLYVILHVIATGKTKIQRKVLDWFFLLVLMVVVVDAIFILFRYTV